MSKADHRRLLALIVQAEGMVLLSGYPHPLYKEALASWECLTFTLSCPSAVRAYAYIPKSEIDPKQLIRTECVWMNPACMRNQRQPTLFQDLQDVSASIEDMAKALSPNAKKEGYAPRSIIAMHKVIHKVLANAVKW